MHTDAPYLACGSKLILFTPPVIFLPSFGLWRFFSLLFAVLRPQQTWKQERTVKQMENNISSFYGVLYPWRLIQFTAIKTSGNSRNFPLSQFHSIPRVSTSISDHLFILINEYHAWLVGAQLRFFLHLWRARSQANLGGDAPVISESANYPVCNTTSLPFPSTLAFF